MNPSTHTLNPAAVGSLLGLAAGDAIGLPYEGLSPQRAARLFGAPTRHRLCFGHGMVSDDTEHACMTAAALAISGGHPRLFAQALARQLRWWLAALPGGVGMATARACIKLWFGVSPLRSGVRSAGNGPAMRATILGACVDDPERLRELVTISSEVTHNDPRAIDGALIVALATRMAKTGTAISPLDFARELAQWSLPRDAQFAQWMRAAIGSAAALESTAELAQKMGLGHGVSGFIVHTVPVVIHAWLSHQQDLRGAVEACILCGGDADTTAAIVGGIVGARGGDIPHDWLEPLWAAPRSLPWMRTLAEAAARAGKTHTAQPVPGYAWPLIPLRNLAFLAIVLGHGFRRLLPPY